MAIIKILSPSEQVAQSLELSLIRGSWKGRMPGAPKLAAELGVDPKTVDAALKLLEARGILETQGAGKRRRIALATDMDVARPLRIGIMVGDPASKRVGYLIDLQHGLVAAGHDAYFMDKSMEELGMDAGRIHKMASTEQCDACVVAGGSQGILNGLQRLGTPLFALFGRMGGLPIAGTRPDKVPAYEQAVKRLINLGHRRIVLLARKMRRVPEPGRSEASFLRVLRSHGIPTGSYNLPDWEDDKAGFHALLESLFRTTPPTALIIQEAFLFTAAYHSLASQGLRVPGDVSLICTDYDISFAWSEPAVTHIRWDSAPMVRLIVKWAAQVSNGKADKRQTMIKAVLVEGGTIGAVKQR